MTKCGTSLRGSGFSVTLLLRRSGFVGTFLWDFFLLNRLFGLVKAWRSARPLSTGDHENA